MSDDYHRFFNASCGLDNAYEGVAAQIAEHAELKTLPTHADIDRWARAIACAEAEMEAAENEIALPTYSEYATWRSLSDSTKTKQ